MNNSIQNANFWTIIGTIGFFISNFSYTTELFTQFSETTIELIGCDSEKIPSIFGIRKIGNISAFSYTIGCSIALIATLGICYAAFYQLLFYQNNRKQKYHKINTVRAILNKFSLLGSLVVVNVWISGTSLSVFLLCEGLSPATKMVIMVALFLAGIIPSINYTKQYAKTLPKPEESNKDDPFLQSITNAIFICTGFFCNAFFLASLLQTYFFYKTNSFAFAHITIVAWEIGSIISLFLTASAVYVYPIIFGNSNAEKPHSRICKPLQYLALAGYTGTTIRDIFFTTSISLIYITGPTEKNIVLTFIYIAALSLGILCTVGPLKSAKIAITQYNNQQNTENGIEIVSHAF